MLHHDQYAGESSAMFLPMTNCDHSDLSYSYTTIQFVSYQAKLYDATLIVTFYQPLYWKATDMGVVQNYFHTSTVVLVRYSIYRSIATLVNVRYRYFMISRYFDMSSIEWGVRYLTIYRSGVGIVRFDTYKNCGYRSIAQNLDIAIANIDSSMPNSGLSYWYRR